MSKMYRKWACRRHAGQFELDCLDCNSMPTFVFGGLRGVLVEVIPSSYSVMSADTLAWAQAQEEAIRQREAQECPVCSGGDLDCVQVGEG